MRSIFAKALCVATSLALPAPCVSARDTLTDTAGGIQLLEYTPSTAYAKFSIPCPDCFYRSAESGADDSLVLELQVNPTADLDTSDVVLNGQKLDIIWGDKRSTKSSQLVVLTDSSSTLRTVTLSWAGSVVFSQEDDLTQTIYFQFKSATGDATESAPPTAFVVVMRPSSPNRLVRLVPQTKPEMIDFEAFDDSYSFRSSSSLLSVGGTDKSDDIDLAAELETLGLLEAKASELNIQIAAKKKAIAYNLKHQHDKLCLKHLIKECDSFLGAAKAVAQRICDKVGIKSNLSFEYAKIKTPHLQQLASLNVQPSTEKQAQSMELPLMMTKDNTFHAKFQGFDLVNPPNPLVRALQIFAAILGISTLFAFLRRKCMSMRKRVERRADLEERRNARAYKRAARRALMRKRWDDFVSAVNCFKHQPEQGTRDYEEKRALILQDAFLEQDLDQAEKGEVMEAEIRELRHAHEIVSSMVRADENRYDLATLVYDPPPPMVQLPYTPTARSRASTYTLPSYTSESLPDYSSRPGDAETSSSGSVMDGFTPPTSDGDGRRSPESSVSASSRVTRYTPTSSVLEMSPRPSQETLRTRPSRDQPDR